MWSLKQNKKYEDVPLINIEVTYLRTPRTKDHKTKVVSPSIVQNPNIK